MPQRLVALPCVGSHDPWFHGRGRKPAPPWSVRLEDMQTTMTRTGGCQACRHARRRTAGQEDNRLNEGPDIAAKTRPKATVPLPLLPASSEGSLADRACSTGLKRVESVQTEALPSGQGKASAWFGVSAAPDADRCNLSEASESQRTRWKAGSTGQWRSPCP